MSADSAANRLHLEASVVEREALRYTPAGVPMLALTLHHRSDATEAGTARQVDMTIAALVAGELTGRLLQAELGFTARFTGFLAPTRRQARTLVFHITELQDIGKD